MSHRQTFRGPQAPILVLGKIGIEKVDDCHVRMCFQRKSSADRSVADVEPGLKAREGDGDWKYRVGVFGRVDKEIILLLVKLRV